MGIKEGIKSFRELRVSGPADKLRQFIECVEQRLDYGWKRDEGLEGDGSGRRRYAFVCDERRETGRQAAVLFMVFSAGDEQSLDVANILPKSKAAQSLGHDRYNLIIKEFYERFVCPAADSLGLKHELTPPIWRMEDHISTETYEKLRRALLDADRDTGPLHSPDRERWLAFLFQLHREKWPIGSPDLECWLRESEGFYPEVAEGMAQEFNFAHQLLTAYDTLL